MHSAISHVARAGSSAAQSHATRAKLSHALAWRARCDIWRAEAHTGAGLHARTPGTQRAGPARVQPCSHSRRARRVGPQSGPAEWAPARAARRKSSYTRSNSLHRHKEAIMPKFQRNCMNLGHFGRVVASIIFFILILCPREFEPSRPHNTDVDLT